MNKLTPEDIQRLKEIYKGLPLYKIKLDANNTEVVYTSLSASAYSKIMQMLAERDKTHTEEKKLTELYDRIWDECVVWPKMDFAERQGLTVGAPVTLYRAVLESSGFQGVDLQGRMTGPISSMQRLKNYDTWGKITPDELSQLKASTGSSVWSVVIGEFNFVVRPMLVSDMSIINQYAATNDINMMLVKALTLWPKTIDWESLPAGIIMALGSQIQSISGADTSNVDIVEL